MTLKDLFTQLRTRRSNEGEQIAFLESAVQESHWSDDEREAIYSALAGELHMLGRADEALQVLQEQVERKPEEPFYLLCLAEHFHYHQVDLARAKDQIGDAILKAKANGTFVYQSLAVQARLAIETQDWPLLSETLIELTCYEHRAGNVDVFPESEFLARIPEGVVKPNLIDAYEARVAHLKSIGYSTIHGAAR